MGNCNVVGPNEAMVVSGGCCSNGRKVVLGGCLWSWWFCTDVQKLSLNVMTLLPKCEDVETLHGVAVTVTGVAQVKVVTPNDDIGEPDEDETDHPSTEGEDEMSGATARHDDKNIIYRALEQFLGKPEADIHDAVLQTLEGHLRAILGRLTVEDIYSNREAFANAVMTSAYPDLLKMGLEIVSFTIKDVTDNENYLDSLGKTQTAAVTRDADIGIANASKDAGIAQAIASREQKQFENEADTAVANFQRAYETAKATYDEEVNTIQAEANLAYKLQAAKCQQAIREAEVEVEVVQRTREIEVQQKEVLRQQKELVATVHRPAEAEKYKVETLAEANRTRSVLNAQGEAEGIKVVGASEAHAIRDIGEAKANAMKARADAFNAYGKAATTALILESLPKIAAEVAAPLAKTKEIVVLSGDENGVTGQVSKLVSQLPPAVQALTGIDLSDTMKTLAGKSTV